jgi:hypothetical protein
MGIIYQISGIRATGGFSMVKYLKIYCASRASVPERPEMWKKLRAEGANIISTWIDESEPGATISFEGLWIRIESEIRGCDRLVLFVGEGDFPLKGALVEVGMALGMGKPVFVVTDIPLSPRDFKPLGSWAMHPLVTLWSDVREACGIRQEKKL